MKSINTFGEIENTLGVFKITFGVLLIKVGQKKSEFSLVFFLAYSYLCIHDISIRRDDGRSQGSRDT